MTWHKIPCDRAELCLDIVLLCGQSFRWRKIDPGLFRSVIGNHVVSLRQDDANLYYQVHNSKTDPKTNGSDKATNDMKQIITDYFQLNVSTRKLHKEWSRTDSHFEGLEKFSGVRVLRQDPVENLFSFICSSNNNISRITSMVENLAKNYGRKVLTLHSIEYYTFPGVGELAKDGVEKDLRELGFGYRAKYIVKSAEYIEEKGGEKWLFSLRDMTYGEAKEELLKLCGVGEKVADCVLLMSLDKPGAIPIDTHIATVARRNYMPRLPDKKTMSGAMYKEIGEHLRGLWGEYSGWAQAVIFSADLPQFKVTDKVSPKTTNKQKDKALKRKRPSS